VEDTHPLKAIEGDMSGHRKNVTNQEAQGGKRQMRMQQGGTHSTYPEIETAEGERSEDME
jgi:hypothetical protein